MKFDYTLDASVVKELSSQNVHVERHDDRTVVTFYHDVELRSTGKDDAGKSLSVGKTPGRRVNIGQLPDGRGVWLQTHLACWKQPRTERKSNSQTADEVAALREQVAALTAVLQGGASAARTMPAAAAERPSAARPAPQAETPRYPMDDDDKPQQKQQKHGKHKRRRLPV